MWVASWNERRGAMWEVAASVGPLWPTCAHPPYLAHWTASGSAVAGEVSLVLLPVLPLRASFCL